jgi:hypothetical protein
MVLSRDSGVSLKINEHKLRVGHEILICHNNGYNLGTLKLNLYDNFNSLNFNDF